MKKRILSIAMAFVFSASMLNFTGQAEAALVAGPDIIPAPGSVVDDPPGAVNDHQQAFDESQLVTLPSNLVMDGGVIPAGTVVSSHMIFLNTEGTHSTSDLNVEWKFDGPILGVMSDINGTLEAASSPILGAPTTNYPVPFTNRGIEVTSDGYTITGDLISVSMNVGEPGDWMRVVTEAVPQGDEIKWHQPPDMEFGVNISSIEPEPVVADDWQCKDPRPVTDVHFWGSYIRWQEDTPTPDFPNPPVLGFVIRIYTDIPAGADPRFPYSHPGELLYETYVPEFDEHYIASILHTDENDNDTFEHKFAYDLDLPEPFIQAEGTIYWIAISARMPDNFEFPWGWETSNVHWNDNATRFWYENNYWQEIVPPMLPPWYQEQYETVDMAFALTVQAELPPPPIEAIKWQQRPETTLGINVKSDPRMRATVADDWLCLDGSPVSDLHFWGSYLGWHETNETPELPSPGVDKFRIQVYSDRPAMPPDMHSRPDKLLYETWTDNFVETYVGSYPVTYPQGAEFEHKFRYDLDLPRIFWQHRDRVYWLNISAVPAPPPPGAAEVPWGWESSMDRWNDFAVSGFYEDPTFWFWDMIINPMTEEFVDMSFELTTCGGPIKWLQFPDMANGKNIISLPDDKIVADDWFCTDGRPIEEVFFWGSYLSRDGLEHWEERNAGPPLTPIPPPPGVTHFKFSFHADIPAGSDPDMPWSHPGELLHEVWMEGTEVRERYWDSIPHTDPTGLTWWEHKFFYSARLPVPFEQKQGTVYWLDIGARPTTDSNWFWGWETSKDHWNDNAVIGMDPIWQSLGRIILDFEDLPLGSSYPIGTSFITNGFPISVKPFGATGLGRAVVTSGLAGGTGKEINVNNVNLEFNFNETIDSLTLLFGEYGGSLQIAINGFHKIFENFVEINGSIIGGVEISVINGLGGDMGVLTLTGPIDQFVLGGQELFIDNVQWRTKVDMAFAMITKDDPSRYCEGDFNRDGDVDGADVAIFAADMGRVDCFVSGDCEGDFDYDGDVDRVDLEVLARDYGRLDCPCRVPITCDDGNPCTQDIYDPRTGECLNIPIDDCGACCLPDLTCVEVNFLFCRESGGLPQGTNTTCDKTRCAAAIGDFVWDDFDRDGIQEAGEPGHPGVVVGLLDCGGNILGNTTTDASGRYEFSNLIPGNYLVRFLPPSGYIFTPSDQGTDDTVDSDANLGNSGLTVCTTVSAGEQNMTLDAGLILSPQ